MSIRPERGTSSNPEKGSEPRVERRNRPDRRNRPTSPWDAFFGRRRRGRYRRATDDRRLVFVDRSSAWVFLLILLLLLMTFVDGLITLDLLETECEEANPLMKYLLEHGNMAFLLGKYILTAIGLPFLIAFKNHRLFRTRFRVGYLIPVFVSLYFLLLYYQVGLIRERDYFQHLRILARTSSPAGRSNAPRAALEPSSGPRHGEGGVP
jgi:hypothetical protein